MTITLSRIRVLGIIFVAVIALICAQHVEAAVYGGNLNITPIGGGISGETSIQALILKIIQFILNIVLILAVLAVIIAGIYLIVSGGDEAQKDKAKNIIFYAIAGILLILLSRVIISFVNSVFD